MLANFGSKSNIISIHALQAECDERQYTRLCKRKHFYPRTPSGVRLCLCRVTDTGFRFLSTHSKRSATCSYFFPFFFSGDFYPRTPSGVRLLFIFFPFFCSGISIHALQAECDYAMAKFYTLYDISIHALQAECDPERSNIIHDYHISIHALQAECDSLIKNMLIYVFLEYKFANNFKNTN